MFLFLFLFLSLIHKVDVDSLFWGKMVHETDGSRNHDPF